MKIYLQTRCRSLTKICIVFLKCSGKKDGKVGLPFGKFLATGIRKLNTEIKSNLNK